MGQVLKLAVLLMVGQTEMTNKKKDIRGVVEFLAPMKQLSMPRSKARLPSHLEDLRIGPEAQHVRLVLSNMTAAGLGSDLNLSSGTE